MCLSPGQGERVGHRECRRALRRQIVETGLGVAFRPVASGRWDLLAKHTYLYDLPSPGQSDGRTDQRAHVFSAEGFYDVSRRLEAGAHLAHKRGSIREDRSVGQWTTTKTNLVAIRALVDVLHTWDGLAEYRWLWVTETEGMRQGALVGLHHHIAANLQLGTWYDFSDCSDDFTDLDDHDGWFVTLLGVY